MSLDNESRFIGRMAAAPDPLGATGVKFRIGTDMWDGQQKKRVTIWVPLVAWGKDADLVRQHVSVGRQIEVRAEYRPREYEQNGQKRLDPQFIVKEIKLLAESNRQAGQFSGPQPSYEPDPNVPDNSSPWG